MPFQSKAQRRKFYALKGQGKIDQKTIDEWESSTPKNIPERIKKASGRNTDSYENAFKMLKQAQYDAFVEELEFISKEAWRDPRQALHLAGGVRGVLRKLTGTTSKVPGAAPKSIPTDVLVNMADIRAQTEAALKANPRLRAVTKQFPISTEASNLRPGYTSEFRAKALQRTPASNRAVTTQPLGEGTAPGWAASAKPTAAPNRAGTTQPLGEGTAVGGTTVPSGTSVGQSAGAAPVEATYGPHLPPRYVSPRQINRIRDTQEATRQALSQRAPSSAQGTVNRVKGWFGRNSAGGGPMAPTPALAL